MPAVPADQEMPRGHMAEYEPLHEKPTSAQIVGGCVDDRIAEWTGRPHSIHGAWACQFADPPRDSGSSSLRPVDR